MRRHPHAPPSSAPPAIAASRPLRARAKMCHTLRMEPAEYAVMDEVEERMWWYRALHARIGDTLASARGRVLDAGCGTGGLLTRLRGRPGIELFGLEYANEAARRAAVKSGAIIVRGSINALPFSDGSFAAGLFVSLLIAQTGGKEKACGEYVLVFWAEHALLDGENVAFVRLDIGVASLTIQGGVEIMAGAQGIRFLGAANSRHMVVEVVFLRLGVPSEMVEDDCWKG